VIYKSVVISDLNSLLVSLALSAQDTHFKLLGFFKEENYLEWMEQLFKHEGYCIWDDDTYTFMQTYYNAWPKVCTKSATVTSSGETLYFDMKPSSQGYMDLGLFSDEQCKQEYTSRSHSVSSVLASYYGSDASPYDIGSYMDEWNTGMDVYKVCQPCRAYKLSDQNNEEDHHRSLKDGDRGGDNFQCDDAAGYSNVNQCMKFASHTKMRPAGFQDLMLANDQGFTLAATVAGTSYGKQLYKEKESYTFFLSSCGVFIAGASLLWLAAVTNRRTSKSLSVPFIKSKGVDA
jgi:hypothetical protein